ncbi:T9SS type A sorting domain-containing protein [Hymenobacter psychrophilus]|uniref:Por secretion system C-terminal sorting domain-containing protein n=1 Tax=Hymenobacter psychrophilus TaxID=651662 RepID=A0A1H3EYK3_9BACT|nr:T9SS type A sorting domain-containing protein [Hymenobacter psychrophilus]SDX83627.1 Por secretion system C-terminal sorting domain-containing protein [Hymenobacter psychrophilus]
MKHFFSAYLRSALRTGLLLLGCGFTGLTSVRAEGSKNLTPGTASPAAPVTGPNDRVGFLQHNDGANSNLFLKENSAATERLYIHMKPSETLYFGVRRVRSNGNDNRRLRLQLKYLDNTGAIQIAKTSYLNQLAASTQGQVNLAANQVGLINTPAEAAVGPRYQAGATGPSGGYNPLTYDAPSNSPERDYWVEFMEVDGTNVAFPANNQLKSWYDVWDFTVRDATGEKPGRLFAQTWSFTGGAFDAQFSTSFGLYPLIPNPNAVGGYAANESFFVKRVSYSRMTPFGVILLANEFGSTQATGRTTFQQRRRSINANVGYAQYKQFVNDPDPSVYPSTVLPTRPTVTTTCDPITKITTFTLNVDQAGFGVVFIDGNRDDLYQASTDRILEGTTVIGNNTFTWDGKSDNGTMITSTLINISFSSGVGPVNFPLYDCESANFAGITVRSIRPGGLLAPDFVYWDDTNLATGFSSPAYNPNGTSDQANGHRWGVPGNQSGPPTGGDGVLVNTYAVGLLARGQAVDIVYDPANACAAVVPPVVLPVTLTKFEARTETGAVRLQWETATEVSSAYFEVERSLDGRQFGPVGRVDAQGSSSTTSAYALLDRTAPTNAPVLYYRLRQVDTDGTTAYSGVRTVKATGRPLITEAYPNPVVGTLFVRLAEPLTGAFTLRVLDNTGRLMWQQQQPGSSRPELEVPTAQLPEGRSYILQVQTSRGSFIQRFVK